jgi:hypothetical protein
MSSKIEIEGMSEPEKLHILQGKLQMLNHCVGIALQELQSLRDSAETAIGGIAESRYDTQFRDAIEIIAERGELDRPDWTNSIQQIQDCARSLRRSVHDAAIPGFDLPSRTGRSPSSTTNES